MKVLLINPPFNRTKGVKSIFMPLGISYLGAILGENDIDVSIYNAELASVIDKRNADLRKPFNKNLRG